MKLAKKRDGQQTPTWVQALLWLVALGCVIFMGIVIIQRTPIIRGTKDQALISEKAGAQRITEVEANKKLPDHLAPLKSKDLQTVDRNAEGTTNIPENTSLDHQLYTIKAGDSIYSIARKFNLEPETILWANYDVLHDNAHQISIGLDLVIPPDNGIYIKWKASDNLQRLADQYRVELKDVLMCPANRLDITNPEIKEGDYLLFPGGYRETVAFNPVVVQAEGKSGTKKVIAGPGGCAWDYATQGTGTFIWPTASHSISGNDFWSGHLGLDMATVQGGPIYASDGGTVVYAGPIGGGYGIMVMLDHGNGYQTLYAHLDGVNVRCGQAVSQGSVIGYGGSTGNSTGPHLHFEVRYGGGFVNPWTVL